MDNRATTLTANFGLGGAAWQPFIEIDLRDINARPLPGHRGLLQFTVKVVFKADGAYRQDRSVLHLWADMRVQGKKETTLADLGRAIISDPIFFEPPQTPAQHDPWMRGR